MHSPKEGLLAGLNKNYVNVGLDLNDEKNLKYSSARLGAGAALAEGPE